MLSSLVEHRHDNADAARLAADGADNALEVGEMLVRTHRDCHTVHIVGHAVIKNIRDDINVVAAQRLVDNAFALSAAEAGARNGNQIGSVLIMPAPFLKIGIDFRHKVFTAAHSDYAEFAE